MSRWLVIALTALLVSVSGAETLVEALVVESHACADDEDHCPPFSDHCGDCARCFHLDALPTPVASVAAVAFPDAILVPRPTSATTPSDAPTNEILTVPRA